MVKKEIIVNYRNLKLLMALSLSSLTVNLMAIDVKSEKEKMSYTIGVSMGKSLAGQGMKDLDVKVIAQAIGDVLSGAKLKLSTADMQAVFVAFRKKIAAKSTAEGASNKKAGDAFRAKNKTRKGVKELASGLQYEILKEAKGAKPKSTDKVTVHYHGTLIDGTVFDSSVKRGKPATFPVNRVIKGWQEVLPLMPIGSKWKVVIPAKLAYGARRSGPKIGPNSTLVFEIELISVAK